MKAVVLAGGEGKRLRPLTEKTPKPLIAVNGIPMIERVIGSLGLVGMEKIIVVVRDKKEVKDFIQKRFPEYNFKFIETDTKNAFDVLCVLENELRDEKKYFFCISADTVYENKTLLNFFRNAGKLRADVIVGISRTKSSDWGVTSMKVNKIKELTHNAKSEYYSSSFKLFSSKIFKKIKKAKNLGIEKINEFVDFLAKEGYDIRGTEITGIFDVDTIDVLKMAEKYLSGD